MIASFYKHLDKYIVSIYNLWNVDCRNQFLNYFLAVNLKNSLITKSIGYRHFSQNVF